MKNKKLAKLLALAMALGVTTAAFASCDQLAGLPVIGDLIGMVKPAATVTISQSTAEILVGGTVQLTATASDGSEVEWESSDKTIASVRDGLVRGAKEGTATITAKVGESTASCVVTVSKVDVTISQATASVEKGESLTLTASASDNGEITWYSSDESIATVKDGVVTALKEGKTTITARRGQAGSASCEVTVVWSSKPTDYAEIVFGEETVAKDNAGTWYYWNDQNWCGTSVTALSAFYAGGVATFQYSDAGPACWFGYQIFYDHAANQEGQQYKLSMNVNSAEEGEVTINGTLVNLKKGDNSVEVFFTEGQDNKASISIQCGNPEGTVISANTLALSNIKFETFEAEKLATPTAVSITNNVVSVTDPTGGKADAIKLNFYLEGELKASLSVKDGDTIDNSAMEDGTYEVKAIAVGSGAYVSSDESGVLATYTVANGGVSYTMENQGETYAVANPGKYFYWSEFGAIADAKYENDTVSFKVTLEGGNWYSNQIFYKNSALKVGSQYTLKMKINSSVAGDITINGNVVSLVEGENEISLNVTEGTNASLSIQMGVMATGATIMGEFSITDIKFEAPSAEEVATFAANAVDLQVEENVVYFILSGNWNTKNYSKAQMETLLATQEEFYMDFQGNPYVLTGGWNGDWNAYDIYEELSTKTFTVNEDGTWSLKIDISSLNVYAYTMHFGYAPAGGDNVGADLRLSAELDGITVTANDKIYTIVSAPAATGDGALYWGNIGLRITDVGTFSATLEAVTLEVRNGKPCYILKGKCANYAEGKMDVDFQRMSNWSYIQLDPVVTVDANGNFEMVVDLSSLNVEGNMLSHFLKEGNVTDVEFSGMEDGTIASIVVSGKKYTARIEKAKAWDRSVVLFTVEETTEADTPEVVPSYSIVFGEQATADANPGKWYFWNDQWWCGSNVSVSNAKYDGATDTATFTYTSEGNCWFGFQVFYQNAECVVGKTYTMTCKITVETACKVTLNGQVVELQAGENNVEITYVEPEVDTNNAKAASFALQCGLVEGEVMVKANTISISGLTFTEVAA